jgi:hypothetical protein
MLNNRGRRVSLKLELPAPDALSDPNHQDDACVTITRLCRTGSRVVKGRLYPELYAPKLARNFPKRHRERNFLMGVRLAWLDATGAAPSVTARHHNLGPFGRLAEECLRLVGAGHTDVVELINRLYSRRFADTRSRLVGMADSDAVESIDVDAV